MFKAKIEIFFFFSVWSQEKLSVTHRSKLESSYVTQNKYRDNCARDDKLVTPLASQTCGDCHAFLTCAESTPLAWKCSLLFSHTIWKSFFSDMKSWISSHREKVSSISIGRKNDKMNVKLLIFLFPSPQVRTAYRKRKRQL